MNHYFPFAVKDHHRIITIFICKLEFDNFEIQKDITFWFLKIRNIRLGDNSPVDYAGFRRPDSHETLQKYNINNMGLLIIRCFLAQKL